MEEEQHPTKDRTFYPYDPLEAKKVDEPDERDPLLDDEGNKLERFDPRHVEDLQGLLFIGALSSEFTWLGHTFVINTLSMDDIIIIGGLIDEYKGTKSEMLAYQTAIAGLCIVSIDGEPLTAPLGYDDNWHYKRYHYARTHWFKPVIMKIYAEYAILEQRVRTVVDAMEKASGLA